MNKFHFFLFCTLSFLIDACNTSISETNLTVCKKLVDIGVVNSAYDSAGAKFFIINTGDNDLVIDEIKPDCHCTIPYWEKIPILARDTAVIYVKYDMINLGFFQQNVTVISNARESPTLLTIRGIIK